MQGVIRSDHLIRREQMIKCTKGQVRWLETALRWKIPAEQRQRIQMVLLRESGMTQPLIAAAMGVSLSADKCLWFIGAFEQLLRQIYRGDAILVSVNDQNRDMNVTNREVLTKLVEHQPTYRQHPIMHGSDVDRR